MSLNGKFTLSALFNESGSIDFGQRTGTFDKRVLMQLADGTGENQVQKIFAKTYSGIAKSTDTDLDLSGTLAGVFGNVSFSAVKGILVSAHENNPGAITLFGGSNPFLAGLGGTTPNVALVAGQPFFLSKCDEAGWAITNSTNDNFRIATPSNDGTYGFDVLIVGI